MYNKTVATLGKIFVILILAGVGHAQYYSTSYGGGYTFGSSASLNSIAAVDSSYATVNYAGAFRGPVFYPVQRTPSAFNFAYNSQPIRAPVFQPIHYSPSSYNFQFVPTHFTPTYGNGFAASNININLAPHFTPSFGSGPSFGGLSLNLMPHQLPVGNSINFGSLNYNFYSQPIPIYATPSRALFNTQFQYASYMGSWY